MATDIEYRADVEGVNQLANGPEVHALLRARAQLGAQFVRGAAPVDTGAYRAGVDVVDVGRGGPRRDRAEVQLRANSDDAVFVEFGSHGRPGRHLLARALDVIERG